MVAQSGHAVADDLSADVDMRRAPLAPYGATISDPPSRRDSQVRRAPNAAGLYDVLDLILDKGIVIDAFVRVSLVGIELLTVDLRVVIASVDTYLRYAEGVERLQVHNRTGAKRLPDMVGGGMKTAAVKKGAEKVGKALTGKSQDDESDEDDGGITGTLTQGVKRGIGKLVHSFTGSEDDEGEQDEERGNDRGDRESRREREPARQSREGNSGQRNKAAARR